MEGAASAGEILISPATHVQVADEFPTTPREPGFLLRSGPPRDRVTGDPAPARQGAVAVGVPKALREHLLSGVGEPEHRNATVGFVHFDGVDELVAERGAGFVADAADQLVRAAQAAADAEEVTFLGTDIDKDGGKVILVSGAPVSRGDDEGRMLRAVRRIADATLTLPVRIGVNRGHIFAGEIGPLVPAHLHRDGRHGEPRGPAHGQGRARPDHHHRRRALALEDRVRGRGAPALHGQGQGEAHRGVQPRSRDRPTEDPRRVDPPARRARPRGRRAARGARGDGRRDRIGRRGRRRRRSRQDPPARRGPGRSRRAAAGHRDLRGVRERPAVLGLVAAPPQPVRHRRGRRTGRRRRPADARGSRAWHPTSRRCCR